MPILLAAAVLVWAAGAILVGATALREIRRRPHAYRRASDRPIACVILAVILSLLWPLVFAGDAIAWIWRRTRR